MNLNKYKEEAPKTLNKELSHRETITNMLLGMSGELGEVIDIMKKCLYQGHTTDLEHLTEEVGDVMFYLVNFCNLMGIDLEDAMELNIRKLRNRYKDGFTVEESVNRVK